MEGARALRWHDIDFAKGYILVRRNIPHHRQVETTKTPASVRKVDMSPELAAELKRLRMERKKQALAGGAVFDAEEWAFRTDEETPIFYTNFLRRVWHKVQDIAKVRRRTPHDLRHTWASHMLAAGADLAYVSAQLGHANPSITLRIYSHWVPGTQRERRDVSRTIGGVQAVHGRRPFVSSYVIRSDVLGRCVDNRPNVVMLRPVWCPNVKGFPPYHQVKRHVHLPSYGR